MSKAEKSYFAGNRGGYNQKQSYDPQNEKRDWAHAENESPEKFEGAYITGFTTTIKLEKSINRAFRMLFSDYYGCVLTPDPSNTKHPLRVDLYFQPRHKESYKEDELKRRAFVQTEESIANPNDSRLQEMVRANTLSYRERSRRFSMTEYASEIIFDFISDDIKSNTRINPFNPETYSDRVNETQNNVNGQNIIICSVDGIDIEKLLGFIYGDTENKSKIYYKVMIQKPYSINSVAGVASNWVVSITKMTRAQYVNAMNEIGAEPSYGSIRINTETM